MIDEYANLLWQFSDTFAELIAALRKVLFKKPRMEFPLLRREKTPHTMLQMGYSFFEFQNADSQREVVVISYEI